ncbi:MAG: DUF3168 domain-containing protein [Methyloceanibacter sp.]
MTSVQSQTFRKSINQALKASSDLASLLGGVRIYDRPPEPASFPFITLGQSALRDWSAGSEDGADQRLTVHVWSPFGGKKHMQDIIKAVRTSLNDWPLAAGRERITLNHEFSEARLDPEGDSFHGIIRYRATTAPSRAAAA